MQSATNAHIEHLPHELLGGLEDPYPTMLIGPDGSGKTHVLRTFASLLEERGIPHVYVDATADDAAERIENAPPRAVLLFDNYEVAPFEVLQRAAAHLLDGAPAVGAAAESHVDSVYGTRLSRLYDQMPHLADTLGRARTLWIQPTSDEQIARIIHRASPERLDAVTVATIQQLAWGRPGWALDLLQLHRSGSLAHSPRPRIRRPYAGDLHLSSLRHPARIAETELDAPAIAAAVVLSEIGPRSRSGVFDVVGAHAEKMLSTTGMLLPVPGSPELLGVPELYAAAMQRRADPELLDATRRRTAAHLLSQEVFGIPLADREAIFCSRVLSRRDDSISTDPVLGEHHARFQQRIIGDLVSFGEGERARDLLLRLGQDGPGLSPLARARLTAVLRDARTGLQVLMVANPPRGNCDLPSVDPEVRFATLLLRARLAAEAGIPLEHDPDIAPDDEQWNDAQLVARRWNDDRPLGSDAPLLLRIALTHPLPEVALLAEQLLSLEATTVGLRYRAFSGSPVDQRISRLAINASDAQRDTLECAVAAQSIIRFLSADRAGRAPYLLGLVGCLPGASRHRIWATHLHAARTAIICGDIDRARFEWVRTSSAVPRFIPWRLRSLFASLEQMAPGETRDPDPLCGYSAQITAYFSGQLDRVSPAAFAEPVEQFAQLGGIGGIDPGELTEMPERLAIRAHLEALHAQNPLALMRAADTLESHGFWAPAAYAMQEARRIFLRRRAAGSVTATDARIAALQAETAKRVPWFDAGVLPSAPREKLTPREAETAKLAAEGLTNREIAERLRCSVRTVESHVSQARAKLGVTSREELGSRLNAAGAADFPSGVTPVFPAPARHSARGVQHAR
ncbi:LuxR C-terminal-related transcriptional regulator [Leucobacter ruminantium]|nr:LuxR C-terminal-related transcriptional regulator [Leucobacter ruminantium]